MYIRNVLALIITFCTATSTLSAQNLKVTIKLPPSGINTVNAITKSGNVVAGTKSGSNVVINLKKSNVSGASFYAISSEGQQLGPLVTPKGYIFLAKKPLDTNENSLKNLKLSLSSPSAGDTYASIKGNPKGSVFETKYKYNLDAIPGLGLNLNSDVAKFSKKKPSQDSDGDGVHNKLDIDADGDGIMDLADSDIDVSASGFRIAEDFTPDIPYGGMHLGLTESINWHIGGSLSQTQIDNIFTSPNKFALGFFFTFSDFDISRLGITGGHVICDSALTYCRPPSAGSSSAVYSGFSEGNSSLVGQLWSSLTNHDHPNALESLDFGRGGLVLGAAIQPRVTTTNFRAGDSYRADFTDSTGTVVLSKNLTLPPYFITGPAIRAYNTTSNSSSDDVLVDYSDNSGPGAGNSNPIVLATSGAFAGKLRLSVWRLQRQTVEGEEGDYMDYGHLKYGVLINNSSGQFSCGELYEGLSSTLTELPSEGSEGSFSSQNGAELYPLSDSSDDYSPSSSSDSTVIGNNSISFTVQLGGTGGCLSRNGLSSGVHAVELTASGVDLGHGSMSNTQTVYVTIP